MKCKDIDEKNNQIIFNLKKIHILNEVIQQRVVIFAFIIIVAYKFMKEKTVCTIPIVSLQQLPGNPEEMQ